MVKSQDNKIEKILPLIVLFFMWETIILFGTFCLLKLVMLNVVDATLLSFLFDSLKDTIKEYSFIDFLIANKAFIGLSSLFAIVLTFGTIE